MAKATLLQTLLGRPSQTYSFPEARRPELDDPNRSARPFTPTGAASSSSLSSTSLDAHSHDPNRSARPSTPTGAASSSSLSSTSLFSQLSVANKKPIHSDPPNHRPDKAAPRPKPRTQIVHAVSKATPSIMSSMTALLEEDEDAPPRPTNPPSAVLIPERPPRLRLASSPARRAPSPDISGPSPSSTAPHTHPPLHHRRSRSLGHSVVLPRAYASSSRDPYHPRASALPALAPGALPSQGTRGYTALVLPRAPAPFAQPPRAARIDAAQGHVDLTRSGVAQTSMASVEVVRGLGAVPKGPRGLLRGLALGLAAPQKIFVNSCRGQDGPSHDLVLGFTAYRPPPTYVPGSSVLVQVWAVALDAVDARLVGVPVGEGTATPKGKERLHPISDDADPGGELRGKPARSASLRRTSQPGPHQAAVGFIPGRSFVGRVLECGWEVREDVVRKGEWVMGLLDVRKSGALTEFIVVDRHRIHRVPYPRMDPPPTADPAPHSPPDPPSAPAPLTLDELALLPLCGVPAHRAVRTFALAFASARDPGPASPAFHSSFDSFDSARRTHLADHPPARRRRALVLRGHDGAGALAVQLLVRRGWRVYVHAPGGDPEPDLLEDRVRAWGVEGVLLDDGADGAVVRVLERLGTEGMEGERDGVDAVLDTVGGRPVWEAADRVLRGRGLFTTLVGDAPARVVPRAADNMRAGLRALRLGAGAGGGGGAAAGAGAAGYAWVSVARDVDWEGEDVAVSLGAVLRAALEDDVRPCVGAVGPLERAPAVFVQGGVLARGGTVVVRVVG